MNLAKIDKSKLPPTWEREQLGMPMPRSEEAIKLTALAEKYVTDTETYDQSVCTGKSSQGLAYPADNNQRNIIDKHARRLREEAYIEARKLGFTPAQFREEARMCERRLFP